MRCDCASQACTVRCGGVVGRSDRWTGGSALGHGTVEMRKKWISARVLCNGCPRGCGASAAQLIIGDVVHAMWS
jgi:hypothetical protein